MGVVQAIAYQTLGKVADKASMKALEDRLGALSRSHGLLTEQHWSTAGIGDVARAMLAKYGVLGAPAGRVLLSWAVRRGGNGDGLLHLSWVERGGPAVVEPTRGELGSRVIRMGLIGSGGVEVRYEARGLTAQASAPLPSPGRTSRCRSAPSSTPSRSGATR